jgi:hydrogenase nickel incorporation protein HypA/HybF
MHEMSLVQSILDIVKEYAAEKNFNKVLSITLSFGKASTVVPAALTFAFEVLSEDTIAQGAELKFDIKPVVIYCMTCSSDITVNTYEAVCPICNDHQVMLSGGTEELKLVEMDVE